MTRDSYDKPQWDRGAMPDDDMIDADRARIGPDFSDSLPKATLVPDLLSQAEQPAFRQVGRYQILERIGRGAMATVYKAYDPEINRTLALKFLQPDLCVVEEHRSRFLREAKAAGGLSHPNIVTVFDVGEIQGRPYIAM